MTTPIRYMTVIEPVLEVTVVGSGSRAVWQPLLEAEGLKLSSQMAEVSIVLSATESQYMGIAFREFSLSLLLDETQALLVQAFNSKRWFAWVERQMFRAPYYPAAIEVQERRAALSQNGQPQIDLSLPTDAALTRSGDESVERLLWLKQPTPSARRYYFHARLEGQTRYFDATNATVSYAEGTHTNPNFALLQQSGFQVEGWLVRDKARHSKSKTYRQS